MQHNSLINSDISMVNNFDSKIVLVGFNLPCVSWKAIDDNIHMSFGYALTSL